MSDETLKKLGSESQNTQDYRKTLLSRGERLDQALKICKVNSSKDVSRKCLSSFSYHGFMDVVMDRQGFILIKARGKLLN
jgi:hypothetical protein